MTEGWLPRGYAEIADQTASAAAESSLNLTRLIVDQAGAALAAPAQARVDGAQLPALVIDMVAGAAFHAGEFEAVRDLLADFWANEHEAVTPVVEQLLRVKQFAAAGVLGEVTEAEHLGAGLLAYAHASGDDGIAAIVWSAYAVLRAAAGDSAGVEECRRRFDALTWDPRLVATEAGTRGLLQLAEASMGAEPAVLHEQMLPMLVAQAAPLVALAKEARSVGRTLAQPLQLFELTERRQRVLWLVARGSTDAAIALELAVAPRTVQGDVAALKAIHGVTSRAALVAAAAPITGSLGGLTPRQHAVVELVRLGYTTRGIATELGISERTVEKHVSSAAARLGVVGRTQLARGSSAPA